MTFPCQEGGASAKAPYSRRGFKDASADPSKVDLWLSKHPGAMWGVPCAMNGALVLDADRHGKGDGVASLLTLFERHHFCWQAVPVVATPNGGFHFYFRRPDGLGPTKARLCDAVDIRDNAYVIAPGCALVDGRSYKLVEGTLEQFATAIARGSIPAPPDWLIQMLVHQPRPLPHETAGPIDDETIRHQVMGIMTALLDAQQGERNNYLYWAACRFADMIRTDLISYLLAEMLLERAGAALGLSERETRTTVVSGLRKAWEGGDDAR
jgi:hypothetical protein